MTATTATQAPVGDYDLRVVDFETRLIGPITDTINEADRLVRQEWRNGFPNWWLYRTALAGDTLFQVKLRDWCIAFAISHAGAGGMRKPDDVVALCAGHDAYTALMTTHWGASSDELANALEVAPKTYRKLRNTIYRRIRGSLDEYWIRMQIGMREAALLERRTPVTIPRTRLLDGRGFENDSHIPSDGNFRAYPRGSGC